MRDRRILIVDDDVSARRSLSTIFEHEGYEVQTAHDGFSALACFDEQAPAVVVTDLMLPGMNGVELLRRIRQRDPATAVVVMTAFGEVESAVEAMRDGAVDYLRKPLDVTWLLRSINRAIRRFQAQRATQPEPSGAAGCCAGIVGASQQMRELFKQIERVAPARATVLISGESGTGKEIVAEALHRGSSRADGPFVRLNCAALSESLLESELFGHERGSFTGAEKRRRGRFEQAHGGTLFLDEIGEISPALQVKLLRVLQERAFERVGGNETVHVDVRVVAATHRDLRGLVAEGKFREDLFYRLDVVSLRLPPLRERPSDIPLLAAHFLEKYAIGSASGATGFSEEALDLLLTRQWPGNVRQLENAVEHALVFAREGLIEPKHLPADLELTTKPEPLPALPGASMQDLERYAILRTMEAVGGSTRKTAELLGISVRKIQYRLREYSAAPSSRTPTVPPEQAA